MAEVSRAAQVGVMAVILGAAGYGAYRFVSRETGTGGGYNVYACLPDVGGIAPHSRATVAGVQVGVIDKLALDPKLCPGKAIVWVKMMPDMVLMDDATIGKASSSLIGESLIVLTPGTREPRIQNNGQIKNILTPPDIAALETQVSDVLKDVKAITASLRETVGSDTGQKRLEGIMDNLASITEQLNETVKENRAGVKAIINNVNSLTGDKRLGDIVSNVKQVTEDVRKMTAGADQNGGKPGEIKSSMERINRASASLESALAHADNIAGRIDSGQGTIGKLTKDETLVNEVQGVVEDVGEFVGGISRIQTVVGLRSDYNFLANTFKNYVELRLVPSEDKYYSIELISDPRGLTSFEQRDVDTTNPNFPPHYREIVTTTTNAFRFSFQFAKRFGPLTGRFGIKESTGGLGLDLHLLDDRFELRQDLFGFGEELSPRWRIALGYEFIRKLWLLGGVDDILNSDRRDYFVGLQLRFTDNDLKTILPFAPKPP